jgi:hypothetical protein
MHTGLTCTDHHASRGDSDFDHRGISCLPNVLWSCKELLVVARNQWDSFGTCMQEISQAATPLLIKLI